jgi:hypothetical protein
MISNDLFWGNLLAATMDWLARDFFMHPVSPIACASFQAL